MLTALLKILRILVHVLHGSGIVLWRFQALTPEQRDQALVSWAAQLMAILDIQVEVNGVAPIRGVLVSNHVSWLDIHVLHALLPARFVSKEEVRDWPLIGRLAEATGTIFLTRGRKSDALRVNQLIAARLNAGEILAIFPEGTTSDGRGLLPFFPFLFQPAAEAGCPVIPCVIHYRHADGGYCHDAAYYGDMSLLGSLWRVARMRKLMVRVEFLPSLNAGNRRELAALAETAVRSRLTGPALDAQEKRDQANLIP
ncbi:MAG: 1-acyl-sn-glycerol-3-phosphate acyltransferase [Betaproteobacteria bacterium]|nr:1-acyl-sn-glycerol-3-phosphate acyltransferase [Betaproteobacteria bacterium]